MPAAAAAKHTATTTTLTPHPTPLHPSPPSPLTHTGLGAPPPPFHAEADTIRLRKGKVGDHRSERAPPAAPPPPPLHHPTLTLPPLPSHTQVLQLKAVLRTAPLLGAALTSSGHELPQNELLKAIVDNLTSPELTELASHIDTVIDEDASFARKTSQRMLECLFAVRPKVCSFLDVTRQTLGDSTRDMDSLVASYADSLGLTDMKLVYTERRGYHLTLPASQREIVERNGFIRIASHAKRTVACSTEQLAQLNNRCKEMIGQILMSTERELTKLQDSIRQRLHVIFAVGESIALLDTLIAYTYLLHLTLWRGVCTPEDG